LPRKIKNQSTVVGLGDENYRMAVCIGNQPELDDYEDLSGIRAMATGDIQDIVNRTSNHWRKIFNIFAKVMFELDRKEQPTWQCYRDNKLLHAGSNHCLLFSEPDLDRTAQEGRVTIVSGKTYAEELGLMEYVAPLEEGFFVDVANKVIVTPYFDYRQLSNVKIEYLVTVIRSNF